MEEGMTHKLRQSDIPGVIEPLREAKTKWYDGIQQTQETWVDWFYNIGKKKCSLCRYYGIQYFTSFSCNRCILKTGETCSKEFDTIAELVGAILYGEIHPKAEAFKTYLANATTMYNNICALLEEAERMAGI